jgi:hypothetical protein
MSTLAGVGVSGYIAFLVSRTQGKTQTAIAQGQQLEQRSMERRQIRRDAYLQFLNQLGVTEQVLENLWQSNPPSNPDEVRGFVQPGLDATSELRRVTNVVILEGPARVSTLAMALATWLTLECADIARVAKVAQKSGAICLSDEETFTKVTLRRGESKRELIAVAQKSLDEMLNPVAASGDQPYSREIQQPEPTTAPRDEPGQPGQPRQATPALDRVENTHAKDRQEPLV